MRQRITVALIVSLIAALIGVGLSMVRAGDLGQPAQLVSAFRWQIPTGWFGGFSGLKLSADGRHLIAVSDRGYFVQAKLVRSGQQITAVTDVSPHRVLSTKGRFEWKTGKRDSEGLAVRKDGSLVVSFEGEHRLERFLSPGAAAKKMPWKSAFSNMKLNSGFEAIALDASDRLIALPEAPVSAAGTIQTFRLENGKWAPAFMLKRDKQFQPVGADYGPDGRLYVLERGFNGFGFRVRVRRFEADGSQEKLLLRKGIGVHDNLEGLSVWRDDQGQTRLTMISDDNFRFLQRTEIVEYVVTENP